jgi:chemotaxis protein MotA
MVAGSLYEGTTLLIVAGGTLLATFLRCGRQDSLATLRQILHVLAGGHLDLEDLRARLARVVQVMVRDGVLRAQPQPTGDEEFDAARDGGRPLAGGLAQGAGGSARGSLRPAETAIRTLMQAAELAPVAGLAGTLVSLMHLPSAGITRGAYVGAIGMAVHATLYGLVLANLLLSPLARLIERRARHEEAARAQSPNGLKANWWMPSAPARAAPGAAATRRSDLPACAGARSAMDADAD